jgi:hypothetical protein
MARKSQDRSIIKGFRKGGATKVEIELVGSKGYRRAKLEVGGKRVVVNGLPTSSHLDATAVERKARDTARRFSKYNTDRLAW